MSSKFKKALSDELRQEYESFYNGTDEHIFSPEFEEQMDKLLNSKKHKKRFFAVPQRRLALRYSLSACTALALCFGVLTIWENHIKDNISDMENMVVPPTTQTTVSVPEATEPAADGSKPLTTDPTESVTGVSQDKTEPAVTSVNYPELISIPPKATTIIGPPKKPVITRISIVTRNGRNTSVLTSKTSVSVISTITTAGRTTSGRFSDITTIPTPTEPIPLPTKTFDPAVTTSPVTIPHPSVSSAVTHTEIVPVTSLITIYVTEPIEIVHPDPTVTTAIFPVEESKPATEAGLPMDPGGASGNTEPPHIAFDQITYYYNNKNNIFKFLNYMTASEFNNYSYESSSSQELYSSKSGKTESADVHVIRRYGTDEFFLAVHFLNTDTYGFYSQVS